MGIGSSYSYLGGRGDDGVGIGGVEYIAAHTYTWYIKGIGSPGVL